MREVFINSYGESLPAPVKYDFNDTSLTSYESEVTVRLNVPHIVEKIELNEHLLHHLKLGDVNIESLCVTVNVIKDEKQENYLSDRKSYYDFQIANFLSDKITKNGQNNWKILSIDQIKSFFFENETNFMKFEKRKINVTTYLNCPCGRTIKIDEHSKIVAGNRSPVDSEEKLPKLPINFNKMKNSIYKDTPKRTIEKKNRMKIK